MKNIPLIIPKEEPNDFGDIVNKEFFNLMDMKQETLEEAKYNAYKEYWNENHTQEVKSNFLTAFEQGVKWKQKQNSNKYSDRNIYEEIKELVHDNQGNLGDIVDAISEWFEQF